MAQDLRFNSPLTRRRFLQYSGAMTLGGSLLAACAGTSSGSSGSASLPTLQQWYHQYGEKGTHEAVLRYAKQYTKANVKVNWVPGVGNAYGDKVNAALLGSNPPDVFEQSGANVAQVKAGQLEPLDDLIADVKDDYVPGFLKGATIDGKLYAIPMLVDTGVIYYRKSLFQKAGIDQEPTTMDELIAAAKKLSNGSMKGIYVGPDGGVNALSYIMGWSAGSQFITEDNKIVFNNDRTALAYEKLKELNASGGVLPDAPTFWWDPGSINNGLCAMQWCGLWALREVKAALGDDFDIMPWPALDAQGKPATFIGGWSELVAAKGKNIDAAKAYVKWLWVDMTKYQADFNTSYGLHVPPRKSTAAQDTFLKSGLPAKAVQILQQYGQANTPYWDSAMDTALTDAVSDILKKGANPTSALSTAADKSNTELQKLLA